MQTRYYTTTVPIINNERYKFKVQARNDVGYSLISDEIVILAARIADIPTDVVTSRVGTEQIKIEWTAPYDGGTPLLAYRIMI